MAIGWPDPVATYVRRSSPCPNGGGWENLPAAARELQLFAGNFQLADGLAVGQRGEPGDVAVRAERCRGFRTDRHRVQVSAARLGADDARGNGEPVDPHLLQPRRRFLEG